MSSIPAHSCINTVKNKTFPLSCKIILIIAIATLVFGGIYAHIRINGSELYVGPLAFLDHTFDVTLALGLSVVFLCIGHALGRRFSLNFANTAEHISFSVFLGTGVVGLSVLCLGLLGLLRPWPITTVLAVYIAVTARDLPDLYRVVIGGIRAATLTREARVVASLFLCLFVILVLRTATPPTDGDELIYHLPVVKYFVQQGRVSANYDNSLGNIPLLIHMSYVVCLVAGSDIAARLFSLFLAIFTAVALYGFCSRFLTRNVGVVAMFGFFAAGMVVEVAVTARIDASLAGMLFLATYSMMNYLETERQQWLWVSAIFAGFSLGIKYSAGLWLLFVGVMYVVERLIRKREYFGGVLRRGLIYTCVAAAIASPWYIKNYAWFHNPVYPFLSGELAEFGPHGIRYFNADDEQKLDAHFDAARKEIPEVVKTQQQQLQNAVSSQPPRHPMRLWTFFTEPNTYLMSEPFHLPNYLFLVTPLLLFLKKQRWVLWLLALSLAFVLSVTSRSWIARYLLPAYPSLTIVASYTLTTLGERLRQNVSFAHKLPRYALAIALSMVVTECAISVRQFACFGFLAGRISRHEFLIRLSGYEPIDFINQLPTTARVMMIGAQMNYGIQRDYLTDETWFATKWRRLLVRNSSLEEVNEDLKRQGVTHILFAPRLFTLAAKWGIKGTGGMDLISSNKIPVSEESRKLGPEYPLLRNWATFTLYQGKFLENVYSDKNGYQIFKIK
jgi:4-amino-4-deoxy-L-arabinose transferase-like glycosyltransferase